MNMLVASLALSLSLFLSFASKRRALFELMLNIISDMHMCEIGSENVKHQPQTVHRQR